MIKLLMSWDIKPGQENEYFEFVVREFVPGIMRLGIQPTEAWFTVCGNGPQILTGGVTEDVDTMNNILSSADWAELKGKLLEYVTNFNHKIVPHRARFQML
ncbi:MAG: hypothetical protein ACE5H9_17225 [Anaerolineae bacterium]